MYGILVNNSAATSSNTIPVILTGFRDREEAESWLQRYGCEKKGSFEWYAHNDICEPFPGGLKVIVLGGAILTAAELKRLPRCLA